MRRALALAAALLILAGCGGTGAGSGGQAKADATVTVYSVDGLKNWYDKQFPAFTAKTGIKVQLVESGSGEVVSRLQKEKSNPQADVAVTLPPFIQRAEKDGLIEAHQPLVNNYLCFIYNPDKATPAPKTWDDLLAARFAKKLQYSTPGQAGDGTAVLLQLQKIYGKPGALDYLKKLEANNVGPSSSTGKLQPKVSKGELFVANGDVQMNLASIHNDKSNFKVFFPADATGKRSTFAIPYSIARTKSSTRGDNARKLIDFLQSAEAQQGVSSQAYGIPVRAEIKPDEAVRTALDGVEIWQPDWSAVLSDLDADIAAYKKAIGQ